MEAAELWKEAGKWLHFYIGSSADTILWWQTYPTAKAKSAI